MYMYIVGFIGATDFIILKKESMKLGCRERDKTFNNANVGTKIVANL